MRIRAGLTRLEWQGRAFLMPPAAGADRPALALNESADRLVQLLAEDTTREALLAVLASEYDEDAGVLAADVDDFLGRLRALGLLEE